MFKESAPYEKLLFLVKKQENGNKNMWVATLLMVSSLKFPLAVVESLSHSENFLCLVMVLPFFQFLKLETSLYRANAKPN